MSDYWKRLKIHPGEPITEAHIAEQTAEFVDAMLAERAKRMGDYWRGKEGVE